MTALTGPAFDREYMGRKQIIQGLVAQDEICYRGAMVMMGDDGYIYAAADTASMQGVVGWAQETVDCTGGTDGVLANGQPAVIEIDWARSGLVPGLDAGVTAQTTNGDLLEVIDDNLVGNADDAGTASNVTAGRKMATENGMVRLLPFLFNQ